MGEEQEKQKVVVHIPEPLNSWIRFTAKATNRTNAGVVRQAVQEMKDRLDKKRGTVVSFGYPEYYRSQPEDQGE